MRVSDHDNNMTSYNWSVAPLDTRDQTNELLQAVRQAVSANLIGLYLHGSLAMGCFNPACSDIDVIAVTAEGMTVEAKRAVAAILLRRSGAPHPIEVSFLRRRDFVPWRYPTPFDLHYSEAWRARFEADLAGGAWRRWNEEEREDPDLAAHITMLRQRGVTLFGPPIARVFPPVPREDYLASILADYAAARDAIVQRPVYGVLNLCRVYYYLRDGSICSKEEGGVWAARTLPLELQPVIRQALAVYRGESVEERFAPDELNAFAHYIDGRVSGALRPLHPH